MTPKLNFGATLIALFLFFVPWLDFQCSGKSVVTQTGIQTIYGGGSTSDELKKASPKTDKTESRQHSIDKAPIIAVSLFATVLAAIIAFMACRTPEKVHPCSVAVLTGLALLFILIQMAIGFPLKKKMVGDVNSSDKNSTETSAGEAASMLAMMQIQVKYTNAFYMQLAALGIPIVLLGSSLLDRKKDPS